MKTDYDAASRAFGLALCGLAVAAFLAGFVAGQMI